MKQVTLSMSGRWMSSCRQPKILIDTLSSGATLDLVHAQLTDLPSLRYFQPHVGQTD